jgi:hypothetical protein
MRFTLVLSLIGLALLELCFFTATEARCPNSGRIISCCEAIDVKLYKKGTKINYNCERCDPGYKVSPSKNQCIPDIPTACLEGYGPNFQKNGTCTKCTDPNCKSCSYEFNDCVICAKGYQYNVDRGNCDPIVEQQ